MANRYHKYILWLALFTIFYNLAEGVVSVWLGLEDETLALFGFGLDSFIEVISGLGILQMVIRIRLNPETPRTHFEVTALRITGWSFYGLSMVLIAGAAINLIRSHKPETTFWGVVISLISIVLMIMLVVLKMRYGRKIGSEAVIADAKCSLVCIYMSVVLLLSSAVYEYTGAGWVDLAGALGLAWFSFREGREAMEKAKGRECGCDHCSEKE